jgi:ATP-binding protein involved in chromosome partitioning
MAESAANPFSGASSTRVLGITSGKGGVGKSSVTVNLAIALSQLGHDVAVLDADVYGFSIPNMLGITDEPDLVDERIIPPSANGVRCTSIGFFVEEDKPLMWRGPMLHKALQQFLSDVEWGSPDYLLIDMPPGTGDVAMSMAGLLPNAEIFVVTTPQPAAQTVAQRSGAMAREIGLAVGGVIENMSWFLGDDGKRYELFGSGGGEALAKQLGTKLLTQLPLVPALREGGDTGAPITVSDPSSEIAVLFTQLAKTIEQTGPRRVYRDELKVR